MKRIRLGIVLISSDNTGFVTGKFAVLPDPALMSTSGMMYNLGLNAKTAEVEKAAALCSKEAHAQDVATQPRRNSANDKDGGPSGGPRHLEAHLTPEGPLTDV